MATQTNTNNPSKTKNMGKFLKNVRAELKKVNWPSRKDLVNYTMVVLLFSTLAAVGIWLADLVFGEALKFIIK
jgi:preprotein translocase subunit SecE